MHFLKFYKMILEVDFLVLKIKFFCTPLKVNKSMSLIFQSSGHMVDLLWPYLSWDDVSS